MNQASPVIAHPANWGALFDAVAAPCLVHADGLIEHANPAMQRLLGFGLSDLQTMSFDSWVAPENQAELRSHALRCLHSKEELPVLSVTANTASGAQRQLELSLNRLELPGGPRVVMTAQDFSDIQHVHASLLESGRLLNQIIDGSPVATYVLDAQQAVRQWNAACAALTGHGRSEMVGETDLWRAFHAEPRPMLANLLVDGRLETHGSELLGDACRPSELLPGAFEAECFFAAMPPQGRWLLCTAAPLRDANGQCNGAVETLQDITTRRQADEELRRHRTELEALVQARTAELVDMHQDLVAFMENASVGIIKTSAQRIVQANRKFAEMFELGAETSAIGMSSRIFFGDDESYRQLGEVATPVLAQGGSLMHETEMRTFKGHRLWVQVIAYIVSTRNLRSATWWLLQDRTEVKRVQAELQANFERIKETNARLEEAQNQLLQSEKMASIGQLAAGVAHEINNPIGFVSSNVQSLKRYVNGLLRLLELYEAQAQQPPAEQLHAVQREIDYEFLREDLPQLIGESEDGLSRVRKIVQDLRDFSRIDQTDWQEADLNAGLESTLNMVMNEVKYKAEVRKELGPLPLVRCLAGQLNQVFMNLIVNAAHAIPDRGVITLSSRHEGDWVCVGVRDTGCGMSPEVQRRIFEPFFTTKPVGKGTGLGLSLVFSIVGKHGGRIEVDSTPGVGTLFEVWVPVAGPLPA